VLRVEPCGRNEDGNLLNIMLAPEVPVDFERLTRHVFASSSCGLCGNGPATDYRGKAAATRIPSWPTRSSLIQRRETTG
jgi:hypothetical protein